MKLPRRMATSSATKCRRRATGSGVDARPGRIAPEGRLGRAHERLQPAVPEDGREGGISAAGRGEASSARRKASVVASPGLRRVGADGDLLGDPGRRRRLDGGAHEPAVHPLPLRPFQEAHDLRQARREDAGTGGVERVGRVGNQLDCDHDPNRSRSVSAVKRRGRASVKAAAGRVGDGGEGVDPIAGVGRRPAHNAFMAYDLDRFLAAQEHVHERVLDELRQGRKTGHWIWFIFPQIAGLGSSELSRYYAISSLSEARAYLAHPVLGARLRACAGIVLATRGRTAEQIFGPLDALKVRSCMTLFHRAAPDDPVFTQVLDAFYGGVADAATDARLRLTTGRRQGPGTK